MSLHDGFTTDSASVSLHDGFTTDSEISTNDSDGDNAHQSSTSGGAPTTQLQESVHDMFIDNDPDDDNEVGLNAPAADDDGDIFIDDGDEPDDDDEVSPDAPTANDTPTANLEPPVNYDDDGEVFIDDGDDDDDDDVVTPAVLAAAAANGFTIAPRTSAEWDARLATAAAAAAAAAASSCHPTRR